MKCQVLFSLKNDTKNQNVVCYNMLCTLWVKSLPHKCCRTLISLDMADYDETVQRKLCLVIFTQIHTQAFVSGVKQLIFTFSKGYWSCKNEFLINVSISKSLTFWHILQVKKKTGPISQNENPVEINAHFFSTLSKIFSRWHIWIFFLFFSENRIWHFMQIAYAGNNKHEKSNPVFWEK